MLARPPTHISRNVMAYLALSFALGGATIAAGCGGDDTGGKGSGKVESEPQIGLNELRACLKRASVPVGGKGVLRGKGIRGEIPLIVIGTDLLTATNLLVLESADAAKRFIKDPPPRCEFHHGNQSQGQRDQGSSVAACWGTVA